MRHGRWVRASVAGVLLFLWVLCGHGRAEAVRYDPASHIGRPFGKGVTFVTVAAGSGRLADGDQWRPGYSVNVVFRPQRAADFYNSLYAWNTGLVLQVDKQGGGPASILSGDLILRHYLADMRPRLARRAVFFGLGAGISHVEWRRQETTSGGSSDNLAFLAECGLEWNLDPALVLVGKGQYRLYDRGGHDHSGWSVHLGAGFPLPF